MFMAFLLLPIACPYMRLRYANISHTFAGASCNNYLMHFTMQTSKLACIYNHIL